MYFNLFLVFFFIWKEEVVVLNKKEGCIIGLVEESDSFLVIIGFLVRFIDNLYSVKLVFLYFVGIF